VTGVSVKPEPFASMTDISVAGQLMELAIHADSASEARRRILEAKDWLVHARTYFDTGGYLSLASETSDAISRLDALADQALSTPDLAAFQAQTLYDFQGTLGALWAQTFVLFGNM
jgi:hypothetical protein